jgi:hypothetical protein
MDKAAEAGVQAEQPTAIHQCDVEQANGSQMSRIKTFYAHPWTQIVLISLICFCCPGVSTWAPRARSSQS